MNRTTWFSLLFLLVLGASSPAAAQSCPGDLDGDNQVTVDELLQSVNRALLGCPPAITLGGPFDGAGVAVRSACANPADNGAFLIEDMTITFTQQGSRFTGRLDAVDEERDDITLDLAGSVDAEGLIRGTIDDDEEEVIGTIHGGVAGDSVSLAVLASELMRSCEVSAALLAVRR